MNIAVDAPQNGEDFEEPPCRIHADVLVKHRPPDLKHGDKIVIDKKVIGQGLRGTPPRRPVLQAEVADRNRRVRRLLLCEWPTLEGTSRHHRVRNIGELLASSGVSGVVAVEHELPCAPNAQADRARHQSR